MALIGNARRSLDPWCGESQTRCGVAHAAQRAWHAVSVVPGALACTRAQQCKGTRFLAAEAPPLPLPIAGRHGAANARIVITVTGAPDHAAQAKWACFVTSMDRKNGDPRVDAPRTA
jgi:hypothetical protein